MARKNVEAIQFHVPEGARDRLNEYAKSAGYAVFADYVRALIEADMKANGHDISLDVNRGKYDRNKETDTEEDALQGAFFVESW